jgi:hypothetical protein
MCPASKCPTPRAPSSSSAQSQRTSATSSPCEFEFPACPFTRLLQPCLLTRVDLHIDAHRMCRDARVIDPSNVHRIAETLAPYGQGNTVTIARFNFLAHFARKCVTLRSGFSFVVARSQPPEMHAVKPVTADLKVARTAVCCTVKYCNNSCSNCAPSFCQAQSQARAHD